MEKEWQFKVALRQGWSNVNIEDNGWRYFSPRYHLYDNYYLYEDTIFELSPGNWGYHRLDLLNIEPHVFKTQIFDKIQELEKAFNKI